MVTKTHNYLKYLDTSLAPPAKAHPLRLCPKAVCTPDRDASPSPQKATLFEDAQSFAVALA